MAGTVWWSQALIPLWPTSEKKRECPGVFSFFSPLTLPLVNALWKHPYRFTHGCVLFMSRCCSIQSNGQSRPGILVTGTDVCLTLVWKLSWMLLVPWPSSLPYVKWQICYLVWIKMQDICAFLRSDLTRLLGHLVVMTAVTCIVMLLLHEQQQQGINRAWRIKAAVVGQRPYCRKRAQCATGSACFLFCLCLGSDDIDSDQLNLTLEWSLFQIYSIFLMLLEHTVGINMQGYLKANRQRIP